VISDKERLDFLEERSRLVRLGISFGWDGRGSGTYKYIEHLSIVGENGENIRDVIDQAIMQQRWRK